MKVLAAPHRAAPAAAAAVAATALLCGGLGAEATQLLPSRPLSSLGALIESVEHGYHHLHSSNGIFGALIQRGDNIDGNVPHFGDTRCPCIGFDHIAGNTVVQFGDGRKGTYPADLGARCEKWDDDHHPDCKGGSDDPSFCAQSWCYVSSCECNLPVLPKPSEFVPDARYRGMPIFFSYATCGGKDMWSKEVSPLGESSCRCIGFDNIPGTTEVILNSKTLKYPAQIGGSCQAWDKGVHPECMKGKDSPKWCFQRWCYVNPCSCDIREPPKVTMYLPEASFAGLSLYYSYATCGAEDTFTNEYNTNACINMKTEKECKSIKLKSGNHKCAWTDSECLGWELVEHPLCSKVIAKNAAGVSRVTGAASAFAASLASALIFLQ